MKEHGLTFAKYYDNKSLGSNQFTRFLVYKQLNNCQQDRNERPLSEIQKFSSRSLSIFINKYTFFL